MGIISRPRGGEWLDDELRAARDVGIDLLVGTLTAGEMWELGLETEAEVARARGIEFVHVPVADRGLPTDAAAFRRAVERLSTELASGKNVAVHCRQGIGRSSLVASALLVVQGVLPDAAWRLVKQARGRPVPDTEQQREWIQGLARGEGWKLERSTRCRDP